MDIKKSLEFIDELRKILYQEAKDNYSGNVEYLEIDSVTIDTIELPTYITVQGHFETYKINDEQDDFYKKFEITFKENASTDYIKGVFSQYLFDKESQEEE